MLRLIICLMTILVTGCSPSTRQMKQSRERLNTFDVDEAATPPAATSAVPSPRIVYSYTVTYSFDRRTVAQVRARQLALCRRLGPVHCVIIRSTLNVAGPDDHVVTDEAVLLIDARRADEMNRRLDALAVAGGAIPSSRQVEAEDVSRQVIDTDARVRAKRALAERLLAIVRSGRGRTGELVEAERAYFTTQEELDAARGQQADLARRVAMSRLTINYAFNDTPGHGSPISASVAGAGATLATSIAALLTALIAGLPWIVVGGIVLALFRWVRRRRGWRWPRRALSVPPPAS